MSRPDHRRVTAHAEVVRIAQDAVSFSNAVSRFRQIPNGLDGAAHAEARALTAPFFAPAVIDALARSLQVIARHLLTGRGATPFDAVGDLGVAYAIRAQSAWLGWSPTREDELSAWVDSYRNAARDRDEVAVARASAWFDRLMRELLDERRQQANCDPTSLLMSLRWSDGRRISDDEVISILRNWTGGDLSSLALCVGVVMHWLGTHAAHAERLAHADDAHLDAVIDEILRLDDPFVSNRRRVASADATVSGCPVAQGEVVTLDWRAANTDARVFSDSFDPEAHAADNVVYGTGIHACPGRTLATTELRVLVREVLRTGTVELLPGAERESGPSEGWRVLPMRIRPAVDLSERPR